MIFDTFVPINWNLLVNVLDLDSTCTHVDALGHNPMAFYHIVGFYHVTTACGSLFVSDIGRLCRVVTATSCVSQQSVCQ